MYNFWLSYSKNDVAVVLTNVADRRRLMTCLEHLKV